MPALSIEEAVEQMTRAVEAYSPLEVIETYNELFPMEAGPFTTPPEEVAPLVARIVAHLRQLGVRLEQ